MNPARQAGQLDIQISHFLILLGILTEQPLMVGMDTGCSELFPSVFGPGLARQQGEGVGDVVLAEHQPQVHTPGHRLVF